MLLQLEKANKDTKGMASDSNTFLLLLWRSDVPDLVLAWFPPTLECWGISIYLFVLPLLLFTLNKATLFLAKCNINVASSTIRRLFLP